MITTDRAELTALLREKQMLLRGADESKANERMPDDSES
jgi:hypothetical protein